MNIDLESIARLGMQCFMRDGKPEEIAAHMQSVAASHLAEVERLRAENEYLLALVKALVGDVQTLRAELLTARLPKPRPMPTDSWQPMPTVVHE